MELINLNSIPNLGAKNLHKKMNLAADKNMIPRNNPNKIDSPSPIPNTKFP